MAATAAAAGTWSSFLSPRRSHSAAASSSFRAAASRFRSPVSVRLVVGAF